jgi:hypothetical protein
MNPQGNEQRELLRCIGGAYSAVALGLNSPQAPGKIGRVELLGWKGDLKWKQDESSLRVEMPAEKISDIGITLRVELA